MYRSCLIIFLFFISILFFVRCNVNDTAVKDNSNINDAILNINKDFSGKIKHLQYLAEHNASGQSLQQSFTQLRYVYKKMEWAIEYFLPHSSRFINGPALPEIELEENTIIEPEGLQVIEEILFPYDSSDKNELIRLLKKLDNKATAIQTNFQSISINRSQAFDAIRLEIFRISSLGIAGFDVPITGNNIEEIKYALSESIKALQLIATDIKSVKKIDSLGKSAISYLEKNNSKDSFNYAIFLKTYLNTISKELISFKTINDIADVDVVSALNKNAETFFSRDAFNSNAFTPAAEYRLTPEKIILGKRLFFDPILSQNSNRSCGTCHNPEKAFTDGRDKSLSLNNTSLARNTPSLNYAAFQHGQFWDMRKNDLEGQSADVIANKEEMHGSLDDIINKINGDTSYQKVFQQIYKTTKAETWQLQNALAGYVRSLSKFNSNFDKFMAGSENAMTENQIQGFNLFVGKAKCASCHFIPLFNGTIPPQFTKTEQEVLGTAKNARNKELDTDLGRGKFYPTIPSLQYAFKTPTLRNIDKTAPYMHNGGYKSLMQIMDFYDNGGGKGLGLKIENQTLPEAKLKLTLDEKEKIIDFLKALNDE